jgi:hypothetical protein
MENIWEKYPNYSDDELRILAAVTAQVLLDTQPDSSALHDLLTMSPLEASRQLLPELQANDTLLERSQVQELFEDKDLSIRISLYILGEVRKYPELAQSIANSYNERTKKMAVAEILLLTAPLTILAIKLKSIKWGDKEFTFYESSEAIKSFLTGLFR